MSGRKTPSAPPAVDGPAAAGPRPSPAARPRSRRGTGAAPPFLLALDQGTTSSRAIVFGGARLRVAGVGRAELPQIYPRPGWVEHDPEQLWQTQRQAVAAALAQAGLQSADVAAVGVANQRETAMVWDRRTGRPIHNAVVWQCRRTADLCARLEAEGWGPAVSERSGLRLDPYFSGTKVAWILDHVPGARDAARQGRLCFGTVDAWLLWRLTGGRVHATEPTNASRTMLYDIHRLQWNRDILDRLGIPAAMLPEVLPTVGSFGRTDPEVFGAAVPVTAMAGDQQAALFGQGCWDAGGLKNTYGTGCFLLMHTGSRPPAVPEQGLLTTIALGAGPAAEYALEGSVFTAGAAVQWLRDGLGIIRRAADVERMARGVPDSGGVWFVPAFTGLGTPHWDAAARGALLGLTRGVTAGHICRAALEAIAHQTREVYGSLVRAAGVAPAELRVDGGAAVNDLLLQIQADLLGLPVVRPRMLETTALGAALLAGLGAGVWRDRHELAGALRPGSRFVPEMGAPERARQAAGWDRAVGRTLGWAGGAGGES